MRISDWSSDVCSSDLITGEMPYASLQKRVSEYLHDIVRQVLKPGGGPVKTWPTLYSLRHQLLADAKRTLTQPEVAAIAGHASDATAGQHYGRRRSGVRAPAVTPSRSEEHTSELQSLMCISYAVFCLKKKRIIIRRVKTCTQHHHTHL